MAYMSQEKKKALAPGIKKVLDKYGLKGTLKVRNHSTLCLTIKEGRVNFYNDALNRIVNEPSGMDLTNRKNEVLKGRPLDVNLYWIDTYFEGKSVKVLQELKAAMQIGNHNNSRIEIDYFDVGWYNEIKIGNHEKPYVFHA